MKKITLIISSFLLLNFANSQVPYFSWVDQLSGNGQKSGRCLTMDGSGNIIVGGMFDDFIDANPGPSTYYLNSNGGNDVFISKYDSSGNFLWGFSFGGTGTDEIYGMVADPFGNFYITGHFANSVDINPLGSSVNLTSQGFGDIFVCKYNSSGILVWGYSFGSPSGDKGSGIELDNFGNVYITGWFTQTVDFDPGPGTSNLVMLAASDAFLLKLDNAGNYSWAKQVAGSDQDEGYAIKVDNSGNVYWGGNFELTSDLNYGGTPNSQTSNGYTDAFLNKYNSSGNLQWSKNFGGPNFEYIGDIEIDSDDNLYISGHFGSTVDFDPGPGTTNLTSIALADIYLSKFDANGNFKWVKQRAGSTELFYAIACHIVLDTNDNIFTAGSFTGTVDFDPNAGISNQTAPIQNAYICLLDTGGNFQWVSRLTGDYSKFYDYARTNEGVFYCTGIFNSNCDFDPGPGTNNLNAGGVSEAFLLKLNTPIAGAGIDFYSVDFIIVYPNPANQFISIRTQEPVEDVSFSIVDIHGKRIWTKSILYGNEFIFDIGDISPGVYLLEMSGESGSIHHRIVKQ